jgi:2-haloacid dehalogenase
MGVSGVKALAFDVFGTVVDWRGSLIEQFQAFGRGKGLSVDWVAFVDDWKRCYRPGMDKVREGKLPWTNVNDLYRMTLDALLDQYGVLRLSESEKVRLNRTWHQCRPWPDVVAGLTRLKRKYVLSTLSNGDVACLVNMARHGGLPWDCVLCAEIFRHYKPDPEVYRGAIELLALGPHEIMMVAAHNYDLRSARSHGMRTAFVRRPLEYGPGQTSDLKPEEDWDLVAGDFVELAAAMA